MGECRGCLPCLGHMNLTSLTVCDRPDSFVTDDNGHTFLHFQYIEDTGTEIHRHTSPLCLDLCSAGLMPKLLVHEINLVGVMLSSCQNCFDLALENLRRVIMQDTRGDVTPFMDY